MNEVEAPVANGAHIETSNDEQFNDTVALIWFVHLKMHNPVEWQELYSALRLRKSAHYHE